MYQELYQFLLQHKQLPVPGIGTFLLERTPAVIDFPNRRIDPPVYVVAMDAAAISPSKQFFDWLAGVFQISSTDAANRFQDFAVDLEKQIKAGDTILWNGVGTISKGLSGNVKFIPAAPLVAEQPVPAEKVIRQKAEHMVRVGEDQKTSAEMTVMLTRTEEKRSYWWIYAAAVALLAVMFIGWYFSEHGVAVSSTGNNIKLVPQESAASPFTIIP